MTTHSSKPYELTFENRRDYLFARVKAPKMDRSTAFEYLGDVADECARTRCKRMLIERDIPTPVRDPDGSAMHDFVRYSTTIKIAIVSPYEAAAGSLKRVVDLGKKRGVQVGYFASRDKAEKWLLQETNGPSSLSH